MVAHLPHEGVWRTWREARGGGGARLGDGGVGERPVLMNILLKAFFPASGWESKNKGVVGLAGVL